MAIRLLPRRAIPEKGTAIHNIAGFADYRKEAAKNVNKCKGPDDPPGPLRKLA
ncbi:MAG: hypothetical protein NVV83_20755 [Afipia sp.]|jgi:hypothetical protein|nr:hypothetical protein [Afipia sp.]